MAYSFIDRMDMTSLPFFTFSRLVVNDIGSADGHPSRPMDHLDSALTWLCTAHDITSRQGVSYGYSLKGGWRLAYRETSGYIAKSFFELAQRFGREDLKNRALDISDWLISVQNDDGSFSNPQLRGDEGLVFDTGQVLLGLSAAYRNTGEERYLKAADSAAHWLVQVSDVDGVWTRKTFNDIPHVYNARVAWALLDHSTISPRENYSTVAKANLEFALRNYHDGWFSRCGFEEGGLFFTHTIAYAVRGLIESYRITEEARYLDVAVHVADSCLQLCSDKGRIPGRISAKGEVDDSFTCLTGNAQLVVIWMLLVDITGEERWREGALRAIAYLMKAQMMSTQNPNIRGAIAGSKPIWGNYSPFTFPNWATKFYVDALLSTWDHLHG